MEKITCPHCGADNRLNVKYCSRCGQELPKPVQQPMETAAQPKIAVEKKKLSAARIIGIVFAIACAVAAQHFLFSPPSYDKVLVQVANEVNKACPIMVDKETQLDNALPIPPNSFQYNYTLISVDKGRLDTNRFKAILEPTIINGIKTSPQLKYLRDHNTTVLYSYKDRSGQYLCTISVPASKYQ